MTRSSAAIVTIRLHEGDLTAATNCLASLANVADRLAKGSEAFISLLDFAEKGIPIEMDGGTACADEVIVRLKPSNSLRRFLAAVRAGDVNGCSVQETGHDEFPIVVAENSTITEAGAAVNAAPVLE